MHQGPGGQRVVYNTTSWGGNGVCMQVIFFEHVLLYNLKGEAGGKEDVACLEKAELVREGKDCVIFTYSRMRWTVMQAVAQLEQEVPYQHQLLYQLDIIVGSV